MRKSVMFLIIGFLAITMLGLPGALHAQKNKPITIGLIHSFSGTYAIYGETSKAGAEIAIEEINAKGGILGRPLRLICRDDKSGAEAGVREAKDLVVSEKVDFLTGTISSSAATGISDYVKREKILFLINVAQSSTLTEENFNRYVFRINTNTVPYWGVAPAIALAKTKKSKKIISLGFDYLTGRNTLKVFKETYLKLVPDAQIIEELWAPMTTTDWTPYISKMASSGADAFFLASIAGGGELSFSRQAYAAGLYDKMLGIQPCLGDVETWSNVKKGEPWAKDALTTTRFPFWMAKDKRTKDFVQKHIKKAGFVPSYGAANMYYIIYTMKAAIEKVGALDTEKLIPVLETMNIDTFFGKVPIRAYDHQAMMPNWFGFFQFDDKSGLTFPHPKILPGNIVGEEGYHTVEQIKKLRGK